jgi:hypothetical protein
MRRLQILCAVVLLAPIILWARQTAVALAVDERVRLDGRLDEAVWQRAPVHEDFIQFDPPPNGAKPPVRTAVQIAYDDKAIYFAVTADDPRPEALRAPFVRRDKVLRDQDFVVLFIDPIGLRKSAQFFRVSARGAIADGLYTADTGNEDFSPDFDWDSAAHIHDGGYTVEIRIPWSELRYTHEPGQWRLMVGRRWPREQNYLLLSVPLKREQTNFIAEVTPIDGLGRPPAGWSWQIQPTVTARRLRESPQRPGGSRSHIDAGVDVKVRPHAEWVVDATLNPDFSQVELDVPQLSRNSQFALFFAEKRPFFLESRDLFELQSTALYSRSIADPRWGARVTHRGANIAGAALIAGDDGGGLVLLPGPFSTGYAPQPKSIASNVRVRWADSAGAVGLLAADRRYHGAAGSLGGNRIGGLDGIWLADADNRLRALWLVSSTDAFPAADGRLAHGARRSGHFIDLAYDRHVERSDLNLRLMQVDAGFRNDSGFTTQSGYRSVAFDVNHKWFGLWGFNEFTPYVNVNRSQTLAETAAIGQELTPGLYLQGGRGLEVDIQLRPLKSARATLHGPLHHIPQLYVWATAVPSAALSYVAGSIEAGKRVDFLADRARSSVNWMLEARVRAGQRLELEPRVEQGILRGDDGRALTETAARMLGVLHFGARDALRIIAQRVQADRRADAAAGIAAAKERGDTLSLVYAHRRSAATVFYAGATLARNKINDERSRSSEIFVKGQVGF